MEDTDSTLQCILIANIENIATLNSTRCPVEYGLHLRDHIINEFKTMERVKELQRNQLLCEVMRKDRKKVIFQAILRGKLFFSTKF